MQSLLSEYKALSTQREAAAQAAATKLEEGLKKAAVRHESCYARKKIHTQILKLYSDDTLSDACMCNLVTL